MRMGASRSGRPRGEVNEIIAQLEHLSMKDGRKPDVVQLKRDCFQKLIKYMTTGIDMSAAFIPATKCVALSKFDLPLKKMLYLYLRSAARHNSAVALLVVQTMLTDCKDTDPTIRGLAVRSMASLRVPDLMENVYAAVEGGLKDPHPYVREAAVMGVLKCYHQDEPGATLRHLPETVLHLLGTDTDPQVVANCLYVLQQLGMLDGVLNKTLVVALLNHIRAFSDWAQCLVLEVMWRYYRPATEDERFDVLEVLDFGLNHVNSAVVMATVKLFLHYTANYPEQYARVLESIRGPLQTLIQGREPEVVYAVLSNVLVLAQRHPQAFTQLSADFFYRPEDPFYLKTLKIDALVATASPSNAYDAAEEASQYARDRDADVAKAAVRCIARIAIKVPEVDGIIDRLLLFLNHTRPAVSGEALVAMVDVMRRFPDAAEACVDAIASVDASALSLPEGKAAFCWALGEFGDRVQDAPYVLEGLVDGFDTEDVAVRTALLTAIARLFFKRPPECKPALAAVLAAASKDPSATIRERAGFYYHLLSSAGPEKAAAIIGAPRPSISSGFEDSMAPEVRDKIFDELNTLSVIYRAPESTFIDLEQLQAKHLHRGASFGAVDDGLVGDNDTSGADGGTALLLDLDNETEGGATGVVDSTAESSSFVDELSMLSLNTATDALPQQPVSGSSNGGAVGTGGVSVNMLGVDELDMLAGLGSGGYGGAVSSQQQHQMPVSTGDTAAVAGLDDWLGEMGGLGSTTTAQTQSISTGGDVSLVSRPNISANDFQQAWSSLSNPLTHKHPIDSCATSMIESRGFKDFVAHIGQANIASLATPREGSQAPYRFLFYAQREQNKAFVLVQIVVNKSAGSADIEVKSQDAAAARHVFDALQTLLLSI